MTILRVPVTAAPGQSGLATWVRAVANAVNQIASETEAGVGDGDKGDIVVSDTGATWEFDSSVVSAFARTVLDDTTAGGVRSTIGAQADDATLTALAGLNSTAGLVEQTGADAFTKRAIGAASATDILTRADGDGRYSLTSHNHTGTYQPLDTQLTDLAGLSYTGNASKVVAVKADETGFEFVSAGGAFALDDATDVDTAGAATGDVLTYDGADWGPAAPSGGGYEGVAADVPLVADFSWFNQGGASASDGTDCLVLTLTADSAYRALVKTAPTAPYDIYARFEAFQLSTVASTSSLVLDYGIMLRDGVNGDSVGACFRQRRISGDEQDEYSVFVQRITNVPAFSATALQKFFLHEIKWIRVNVTSTTITIYLSPDGRNWVSAGTETIATFVGAVTQVGIFGTADTNSPGATVFCHNFSTTAPS